MSKLGVELNITAGGIENVDKVADAVNKGNTSLKEMKKQLREVTNELLATEPGTEKFVQLTQQAGALKDQMKDVAESINANAGPAVESLGNNFQLLTGKLANLDFQGAGESIKAIGGNISSIKFKDIVSGIQSMGSAFASVGKALLTNPIFLVAATIVAIGVALKDALDDAKEATFAMANATLAANEASKEAAKSFDLEERKLRALGVAEEEIAEKRSAANKARLEAARAAAKAQLSVVTELQKQVIQSQGLIDAGFSGTASLIYATQEELTEAQEKYRQITSELGELEVRELERLALQRQKAADKQKQIEEDRLRKAKEAKTQLIKNEEEIEEARKPIVEMAPIRAKEIQSEVLSIERETLQLRTDQISEFQKKIEADDLKHQETLKNQRIQLATDAVSALMSLNDAILSGNEKTARKSFAIGKALALAQAVQNTYAAINAVLKDPTYVGPGRFVAAAIAGVQGLANVVKIARTQFNATGSGGTPSTGGGGGGGSLSAAGAGGGGTTPSSGFGAFNASLINNRPQQITPAYVLAGDVKSQGEARQKVEDRARL
jgi:hypothetical protein